MTARNITKPILRSPQHGSYESGAGHGHGRRKFHADRKNGVVIQTHSGGPGAAAADACGRSGPKLSRIAQETTGEPKPLIPKTTRTANPVDMIFSKNPSENYFNIPDVLFNNTRKK